MCQWFVCHIQEKHILNLKKKENMLQTFEAIYSSAATREIEAFWDWIFLWSNVDVDGGRTERHKTQSSKGQNCEFLSFIDLSLYSSVLSCPLFSCSFITVVLIFSPLAAFVCWHRLSSQQSYSSGSEDLSHTGWGSTGDTSVQRFFVELRK